MQSINLKGSVKHFFSQKQLILLLEKNGLNNGIEKRKEKTLNALPHQLVLLNIQWYYEL